jgi:hypothetical protein
MPVNKTKKVSMSKFPLRLMPTVRKGAESFSQKEGVSLNQFINVAVAEKLAHLEHDEWIAALPKVTPQLIARGLAALNHPTGVAPRPEDRVPPGYRSLKRRNRSRKKQLLDLPKEAAHG